MGIGYRPPLYEPNLVDEVVAIATDDARAVARRLAREEGRFGGRPPPRPGCHRGDTLLPDSGLKYLATDRYRR